MGDGRSGVLLNVDGILLDTNYLHALTWWQAFRDAGIAGEGLLQHLAPAASDRQQRAAELVQRCADVGPAVVLATSGQASDLDRMLPAIGVPEDRITGSATPPTSRRPSPPRTCCRWRRRSSGFTSGGIPACQLEGAGADEVYAGPADLLERWPESALSRLG